jgi:hypothetical protein
MIPVISVGQIFKCRYNSSLFFCSQDIPFIGLLCQVGSSEVSMISMGNIGKKYKSDFNRLRESVKVKDIYNITLEEMKKIVGDYHCEYLSHFQLNIVSYK